MFHLFSLQYDIRTYWMHIYESFHVKITVKYSPQLSRMQKMKPIFKTGNAADSKSGIKYFLHSRFYLNKILH